MLNGCMGVGRFTLDSFGSHNCVPATNNIIIPVLAQIGFSFV